MVDEDVGTGMCRQAVCEANHLLRKAMGQHDIGNLGWRASHVVARTY